MPQNTAQARTFLQRRIIHAYSPGNVVGVLFRENGIFLSHWTLALPIVSTTRGDHKQTVLSWKEEGSQRSSSR